jgi:hypothetical protein
MAPTKNIFTPRQQFVSPFSPVWASADDQAIAFFYDGHALGKTGGRSIDWSIYLSH